MLRHLPLSALRALAKVLRRDGVAAAVLNAPAIKPLDEAGRTGGMAAVAENLGIVGGPGEAVAGVPMRNSVRPPVRLRRIGLPDAFLDAGALPALHDSYGISTAAMVRRPKEWLG